MELTLMKFGGTSVDGHAGMSRVAAIVAAHREACGVVVSAMGDTTDQLLALAAAAEAGDRAGVEARLERLERGHRQVGGEALAASMDEIFAELASVLRGVRLLREQTPRSRALIASAGERLSVLILASYLREAGRQAEAVDARQVVVTDDRHEAAAVDLERTRAALKAQVRPLLDHGVVPVITGFLGATPDGITTTLGRGGSDYSAALIGALLGAQEIWIFTDVAGILTADPRLVKEARSLERISYREAAEMSYFGARVLHPRTIGPAASAGIPIRIKSTFEPERPGTLIAPTAPTLPQGVKTVSSIHDLALITLEGRGMSGVPGVARRVFEATEAARVNVMMISQASSEQTISMVVAGPESRRMVRELERAFALELRAGAIDRVSAEPSIAIVSIVGQGMAGTPGIAGKLFGTLGAVGVNVLAIAQGASELSISVAVKEHDAQRAVRAVHSAFGLTRMVNLMVLGCGRVAQTFLRQLHETRADMEARLGLELRLIGLASSQRLLLDDGGVDAPHAVDALARAQRALPTPAALVDALRGTHLTDMVLLDLTAADTAELHRLCLEAGIHVVTANKRPLSGPQAQFDGLRAAAHRAGARLAYETTFGAGLPVLHTLQELVNTGDRVARISGCFSGTLGYLCTVLEEGTPLAEAVRAAEQLGLTEPDPREDLSGRDVARKALIIARTIGLTVEPEDVTLEPLVSGLEAGLDVALKAAGPPLEARVREALSRDSTLRYVADIAPDGVRVGLQEVPRQSPIGALRGQDNILVYHTDRYSEFPLVIRGPGAGTEVTAAGVMGDVLKVVRRI